MRVTPTCPTQTVIQQHNPKPKTEKPSFEEFLLKAIKKYKKERNTL